MKQYRKIAGFENGNENEKIIIIVQELQWFFLIIFGYSFHFSIA